MKVTERMLANIIKGERCDMEELFVKFFPLGSEFTLPNCKKAAEAGLDFGWVASHILTSSELELYEEVQELGENENTAYKVASEAASLAWKNWLHVEDIAKQKLQEGLLAARKAYEEAEFSDVAFKLYQDATNMEWNTFFTTTKTSPELKAWRDACDVSSKAFFEFESMVFCQEMEKLRD